MAFVLSADIYTAIASSKDKLATIKAFSAGFGIDEGEMATAFDTEVGIRLQAVARTDFISAISSFSLPKSVLKKAIEASALGLTLRIVVDGETAKVTAIDPKAISNRKGGKKRSPNRYFVDGAPLFDKHRSIKAAMVALGGFDNVVPAIGPGGAHKVDSKYSDTTSMNAWQALQAFGSDSQKARITRTTG